MSEFSFQVLGANSAIPMPGRLSSCFVLSYNHNSMLLDCGEGAQLKLEQFHVKRSKLDHIFISHLHGDHIFGLPGLLGSLGLNNRKQPLHLYGPFGIKDFVEAVFRATQNKSPFDITFHELDGKSRHDLGIINRLHVMAFPLKHRVPTLGYKFYEENLELNIKVSAISEYQLSFEEIKAAKLGEKVVRNGQILPQHLLTESPRKPRSFAYCTDTIYDENILDDVKNVNLLYHEATYLHDLAEKARSRGHSTALEAATLAKMAKVSKLVIGHYSSRYKKLQPFIEEAQLEFQDTEIAEEGRKFNIE